MTIEHGSIDFIFVAPPPSCWIRYCSHTFFNVDLCLIHVIDTTSHDNITDLKAEKLKLTDGLAVNTGCLLRLSGMKFIALLINIISFVSVINTFFNAASFQNARGTHPSLSQAVHLFHSQLLPFHEQLFHLLPYCINL